MIRTFKRLLTLTFATLLVAGCVTTKAVRHPDAPTLIVDTRFHPIRGSEIRGSVWDSEEGELVDVGWHSASEFRGWTMSKFDWETVDDK
jgi:hypothetical protein